MEPPSTDKSSKGKRLQKPQEESSDEEDSSDNNDDDDDDGPGPSRAPSKKPYEAPPSAKKEEPKYKTKAGKTRKRKERDKSLAEPQQPVRKHTTRSSFAQYAQRTTRCLITSTQRFFKVKSNAVHLKEIKKDQLRFQMCNDTEGAAFAAFYATLQVCAMAASLGYQAEFLPLEPKNQRDARSRPDCNVWQDAEVKEQDTLWEKGTFELVDRPSNYDPIPLQIVYKLKVKDGHYDKGVPKARLVMIGNLQYNYEYGDTYAPTACLWVVRLLAAIAAQEGLTMKKFDLTGAFLNAKMDKVIYAQIP